MVAWVGWRQQEGQIWRRASLDHSIWVLPTIDTIDFRGQRGSETMSCSSHHHHDLAHSICGATLDDNHGLKFRHWRATAAPTRLVGVCATNNYFNQERSAPVSVLHWRSGKLTRKVGSPHLVETYAASSAVVEMTCIKALWKSMTWREFDILTQRRSSRPLKNHDAACDTKRKSSLL